MILKLLSDALSRPTGSVLAPTCFGVCVVAEETNEFISLVSDSLSPLPLNAVASSLLLPLRREDTLRNIFASLAPLAPAIAGELTGAGSQRQAEADGTSRRCSECNADWRLSHLRNVPALSRLMGQETKGADNDR